MILITGMPAWGSDEMQKMQKLIDDARKRAAETRQSEADHTGGILIPKAVADELFNTNGSALPSPMLFQEEDFTP